MAVALAGSMKHSKKFAKTNTNGNSSNDKCIL